MADGGLRLQVDSQEIDAPSKAEVMNLHGQLGWMVFAPQEIDIRNEDIPNEVIEEGQKPLSVQQRACIYVLLSKKLGREPTQLEADRFYREQMLKIIDNIKIKINEFN